MRSRTCNKWIVKSTECWFFPRTKLDQILSKTGFLNLSPWRQPKPLTMQSMRYGGVVGVVASPVPEISSISTCKDFLARKSSKRNPKHNTNYLIKLYLWHLTCRDWKLQNVHQNFVYISCLLISYIKIFQKKTGRKNDQTTNLNHIKLNIFDFLLPILANSIVPSCCCQLVLAGSARSSASAAVLPRLSERSRLGWDRFLASPRVVEIFGEFMRYTDALETNSQLGSLERFSRELSWFLAHFQSFAAIFRECKYMYLPKLVDFWWLLSFNISGHEKIL